MNTKRILLIIFIFLFSSVSFLGGVFACFKFQKPIVQAEVQYVPKETMETYAFTLFNLANTSRTAESKKELLWNNCLAEQARERAGYIAETGTFEHEDNNGNKPFKDMIQKCLNYTHAGENLTKNFPKPEWANQWLMNSPTHRANILGKYKQMGVGCVETETDTYCVQFFAE
jgi:uncharacterized protein YkwD